MHDGRDVVVKITRPGIHAQVQADLRLLRRTMRVAQWVWPPLKRHRPLDLVDELGAFLRDEIDMRHEAQNMRRMARVLDALPGITQRSEEHTSELQSLMRISYAVFCLKNKNNICPYHCTTLSTYDC